MLISGTRQGSYLLDHDLWEDLGDGVRQRVYRKGQRISMEQAVEYGLAPHPDQPVAERLTEDSEEPRPAKPRKRKVPAENKARKQAGNKRG